MGKWYVDYVDLSTCAIGVKNRHSTWNLPARRGENSVVPSRDGSIWSGDKPFEEGEFILEMFAAGAEADGSVPADEPRAIRVRKNIDTITRLFGADRLLTMAYVEDDTQPYGRRNLFPNPSFEIAGDLYTARENAVPNPGGEYSGGASVIRTNYAPNPSMSVSTTDTVLRTNMVTNPGFETVVTKAIATSAANSPSGSVDPDTSVLRNNSVPNPSLEVDASSWLQTPGTIITRSGFQAPGWPVAGIGKYSLKVDVPGAPGAFNHGAQVGPCIGYATGDTVTATAYIHNPTVNSRQYRIEIYWANSDGTFTQANGAATAIGADATGRVSYTGVAPASMYVYVRVVVTTNTGAETFYVDQVMFERAAAAGTYFDGNTGEVSGRYHTWSGLPGVSPSSEVYYRPDRWRAGGDHLCMTTELGKKSGSKSGRVELVANAASGDLLLQQEPTQACDVIYYSGFDFTNPAGSAIVRTVDVSGSINIRPTDQITTARQVKVRLGCYDQLGAYLGPVKDSDGTTDMTDVVVDLSAVRWSLVTVAGKKVRTGTVRVGIMVVANGAGWVTGDAILVDEAIVEPATTTLGYFDGTTVDNDPSYDYRWQRDPHASESVQYARTIDLWEASAGRQVRLSDGGMFGGECMRLRPDLSQGGTPAVRVVAGVLPAGTYKFSIYVRANNEQDVDAFVVKEVKGTGPLYIGGTGAAPVYSYSYTYGTPVTVGTDSSWVRASVTAVLTETAQVSIGVRAQDGTALDAIDFDAALLEASSALREYFDGSSGADYEWAPVPTTKSGTTVQSGSGGGPGNELGTGKILSADGVVQGAVLGGIPTSSDEITGGGSAQSHLEYNPSYQLAARADGWAPVGPAKVYASDNRSSLGARSIRARADYNGVYGVTAGRIDTAKPQYSAGVDVSVEQNTTVTLAIEWYNITNDVISSSTDSAALVAGPGFTRIDVVAAPPAGAVAGAMKVTANGAADDVLYVDKAILGFGADTAYADGDSGSGWTWMSRGFTDDVTAVTNGLNDFPPLFQPEADSKAKAILAQMGVAAADVNDPFDLGIIVSSVRQRGVSAQLLHGVLAWRADPSLTLIQSNAWSSERTNSGLVEVVSGTAPHRIFGVPTLPQGGATSDDMNYFPVEAGLPVTIAVDVHGREAGQVQVQMIPYTWDGWTITPSPDATVSSSKIPYAAGATVRPKITGQFGEDTTHYLPVVNFFDSAGGAADVSQGAFVDSAITGQGSWSGSYFDGYTEGAAWEGVPDHSPSRFVGDARVALCEVKDQVGFDSVGNGQHARFAVRLKAPEVFFRDQNYRYARVPAGRPGAAVPIHVLSGGTARINDAFIRFWGPWSNLQLVDVGSGAWIWIGGVVNSGEYVDINCADWTVTHSNGASLIGNVVHLGSPILLPITPVPSESAPKIVVNASALGAGCVMEIVASRKYFIA